MGFPVAALFRAFKRSGLLVSVAYKPGTAAERAFDAQWLQPDQLLLGDDAHGTDFEIEYQTADAPPLGKDDPLRINGIAYLVRQKPRTQGDGHFTRCLLGKD